MKHLLCCASILALPFLASTQTTFQKILNSIKNSSNNGAKPQAQTTNNGSQAQNLPLPVGPNGLKVGDIAPDAVYIDADDLFRSGLGFNGGAARIYKGSSVALIDSKGKVIVPYNKYKQITGINGACNGLFIAYGDILINAQGENDSKQRFFPTRIR